MTVVNDTPSSGAQRQQSPSPVEPPGGGQAAQRNTPGTPKRGGQEQPDPPDDEPSEPDPDAPVTRIGTDGRDDLAGGGGDLLMGRRGSDVLRGLGGHDELRGGRGHDELFGGKGDDDLVGGKGDDTLAGGRGADRFTFAPRETGDKIVLQTNRQPSIADIIAGVVAHGGRYLVYTLFPGLTVETDVTLRTEDFVVE